MTTIRTGGASAPSTTLADALSGSLTVKKRPTDSNPGSTSDRLSGDKPALSPRRQRQVRALAIRVAENPDADLPDELTEAFMALAREHRRQRRREIRRLNGPDREATEAHITRSIRTLGVLRGQEDPDGLPTFPRLQVEVKQAFGVAVTGLRDQGYSDYSIARALGVSQPAVVQRWSR